LGALPHDRGRAFVLSIAVFEGENAMLTYAVGDIHGCHGKLVRLLTHCERHADGKPLRFVLVGDYIDRGPRSRAVVADLMAAQHAAPDRFTCLRGNHEDLLLSAVARGDSVNWLLNGGGATLQSYGVDDVSQLPREHIAWFRSLPLYHDDGRRFFVHAGIAPGVPLDRQPEEAMLWIREKFLADRRDHGRFIVHGHTPLVSGEPDLKPNRLNLDTGACFGGVLSAAVFDDARTGPLAFIRDDGRVTAAADIPVGG
jgi:serine/threonine protein phosphatase 1